MSPATEGYVEEFRYRLFEVEKQTNKHKKDLYEGNGKAAITVRVALLEDNLASINRNLSKITWLLIGGVFAAVGDIVAHVVVR